MVVEKVRKSIDAKTQTHLYSEILMRNGLKKNTM